VRVGVTRHEPEGVPEVEVTVEEAAVEEGEEVVVEEDTAVVEVEVEVEVEVDEVELEEVAPFGLVKHTSPPEPMVKRVGLG